MPPVLPVVHLNGTSRKELVQQRLDVAHALDAAFQALMQMTPHQRDYYVAAPDLWEQAIAQHARRVAILYALSAEIAGEAHTLYQEGL